MFLATESNFSAKWSTACSILIASLNQIVETHPETPKPVKTGTEIVAVFELVAPKVKESHTAYPSSCTLKIYFSILDCCKKC